MNTPRIFKALFVLSLAIGTPIVLASCGDDNPSSPAGTGNPPTGSGDFMTLSVNGGPQTTYTEASGLPSVDCDPRVDWASNQVVGWANYANGNGPNGYDLFFEIMFPAVDTVGTYTVQGGNLHAMFYNGDFYTASPTRPATSGSVLVTRRDWRIEGTFSITALDSDGTTSVHFAGSFGVDDGFSLSCP
jgi:hypothetical protein